MCSTKPEFKEIIWLHGGLVDFSQNSLKALTNTSLPFIALSTPLLAYIDTNLHIWFGFAMLFFVFAHLYFHPAWISSVSERFFSNPLSIVRIKPLLNFLMFVVFLLLIFSGTVVALIYAPNVTQFHNVCFYIFTTLLVAHLYLNRRFLMNRYTKNRTTEVQNGKASK